MAILGAQQLSKSYGERDVLRGVSLTIDVGDRVGLVGRNGQGKTTLARILAGLEQPDGGLVTRANGLSLGYLEQQPLLDPTASAVEVAMSGLASWSEAMARHEAATAALSAGDPATDALLAQQAAAAAGVERHGGWDVRHRAEAMLGHLGIAAPERAVGAMSGGERRRLAMARLLVAQPDVAILDEPTNHLDVATIEWLERYLIESFRGALVLITHDRYLLDRVVTRTVEVDRGSIYAYEGGWEAYLTARAERAAQADAAEQNRQNFLRRELAWLRRQPKARTGKQKARIDRANAALDTDAPMADGVAMIAVSAARSGKTVIDTRDLAVDIGGQRVVEHLTLALQKGDRVGIVGPNGAGKTTLLRALLGQLLPASGVVTMGANTRVAYLDQSRAGLDDDATVYDNVAGGGGQVALGDELMDVRTYLQRFLFDVPAQAQRVGSLSGGERARVALAKVLRDGANLVVLDEPTNDLDVATLGSMEASLIDFGGTALVVTHDRWFLDRVATSILGFEGGGRVVHVQGGYTDYQAWRAHDRAAAEREAAERAATATPATPRPVRAAPALDGPKKLTYAERLELEGLMARVEAAEAEVATMEGELASPTFASRDHVQQRAFLEQLAAARARAETLVERWAELESRPS